MADGPRRSAPGRTEGVMTCEDRASAAASDSRRFASSFFSPSKVRDGRSDSNSTNGSCRAWRLTDSGSTRNGTVIARALMLSPALCAERERWAAGFSPTYTQEKRVTPFNGHEGDPYDRRPFRTCSTPRLWNHAQPRLH